MSMTTAAYLRVSTGQQSIDQQHDAIAAAGITPDRVFTDTASGRAGSNRPGWTECMGYLREGDHLVVVAVDRLGRSVREVATALQRRAASREARVARGLAATKPMKLDAAQQKRLPRLYEQGEPVSELTSMFGISRSTLFRTLKVWKRRESASV
jgi:DNA invertase Pin-like site-specific DNA recombinase